MEKPRIEINHLNKTFKLKTIFKDFNINFGDYKMNTIIGASGGGKTTLLNIIAGLEPFDGGEVLGVSKEEVSYVFQEDRLIEWENVAGNMRVALEKYYDRIEIEEKISYYLNLVNVINEREAYPYELSGGMKQRVNIARALAKPSRVILMDEPFKSLDYKTKYTIMKELKAIIEKENRIVIFVTHDVDEAIFFGGRVVVLGGAPLNIIKEFDRDLENSKKAIINSI